MCAHNDIPATSHNLNGPLAPHPSPPGRIGELFPPPLPPVFEGPYKLNFTRGEGPGFALLLTFPGPRGPLYQMGGFLKIAEFRAMLTVLAEGTPPIAWHGPYFSGYAQAVTPADPVEVWFRARDSGVLFSFSVEEWATVRALFDRAWSRPDIRAAWDDWMRAEAACSPHAASQRE